jgi:hypothetical protein
MILEPLKRGVVACLSIVVLLGILFALNNWIGSGPAIKQLKESVDSVDAAQVRIESRRLFQRFKPNSGSSANENKTQSASGQ